MRRLILCVLPVGLALLMLGCGESVDPGPMVLWKDAAGNTWQAPLRTPPPDDPVWEEHPGAGVVMHCAKTGQEVLVADPESWLAHRGQPGTPFRSKAGAPLILKALASE